MKRAIVVGAGPAGLSAAEVLAEAGWSVTVVEALGSPARKMQRAGVGGLNLTHSQPFEDFLNAYGPHRPALEPYLRRFGPAEVGPWAASLGIEVFTGSSGRVFPRGMGAAPLVSAWTDKLSRLGVVLRCDTPWKAWGPRGCIEVGGAKPGLLEADVTILALGGPTWPSLGTGGTWVPLVEARGVAFQPWKPANVGFLVDWTPVFRQKFSLQPLKDVVLRFNGPGGALTKRGELMVTPWGLEGGPLYALGAPLRDTLAGGARIDLDLVPGRSAERVLADLSRPREGRSLATHLQRTLGLGGVKVGLLREVLAPGSPDDPARVAGLLKALPVTLVGTRPLDEAISSAGGLAWNEVTADLELLKVPGVYCAGEMLDWEAPTGGYLLTACLSLGRAAARAIVG